MKEELKKLILLKDHNSIKVVMSHRRSGKTKLLSLFREALLKLNVKSSNIIYKNFEVNTLPLNTSLSLYVKKLTSNQDDYYLIFDEITEIKGWEREIKIISENDKVHIVLSSSNKYIYTKEFIKFFKELYVELPLYPVSFKEFSSKLEPNNYNDVKEELKHYINKSEHKDIVLDIYSSIILNDVLKKGLVRDINLLEGIIRYILNNVGKLTSAKKISDALKKERLKASVDTIYSYIDLLINANFIYKLNRYDFKNKVYLKTLEKYYLTNIDFKNALLKLESTEFDSIIENIVYIDLLKKGQKIYIGKYLNNEIDFLLIRNNVKTYYQVITNGTKELEKKKKYNALISIPDSFEKCILTLDEHKNGIDEKGIKWLNIISFLMGEEKL